MNTDDSSDESNSMRHSHSHSPLVLLVDHEASVLADVSAVLTEAGLTCQCCSSPEMALATCQLASPDLIIAESNLGGRSGQQLCTQIRAIGHRSDLPIMLLSAAQVPDIIRRSDAAGGVYYLRKPLDMEMLVELVFNALWLPRSQRQPVRVLQTAAN